MTINVDKTYHIGAEKRLIVSIKKSSFQKVKPGANIHCATSQPQYLQGFQLSSNVSAPAGEQYFDHIKNLFKMAKHAILYAFLPIV